MSFQPTAGTSTALPPSQLLSAISFQLALQGLPLPLFITKKVDI